MAHVPSWRGDFRARRLHKGPHASASDAQRLRAEPRTQPGGRQSGCDTTAQVRAGAARRAAIARVITMCPYKTFIDPRPLRRCSVGGNN